MQHHLFPFRPVRTALLCLFAAVACLIAPPPSLAAAADRTPPSITKEALLDMVRASTGKIVFINFFASWCPPCREEIPELVAIRREYPETALALVGVALDEDAERLASFASSAGFNYPVYRAEADVPALYGVMSIPHNVVYDAQGRLVVSQAGMVDAASLRVFLDAALAEAAKDAGRATK